MDCVVADPNPPLTVRDDNHKAVIGTLNNGERVFVPVGTEDEQWVPAYQVSGQSIRKVGEVSRKLVKCSEVSTSHRYPYVLPNRADLRKFGLTVSVFGGGDEPKPFSRKCFYYGDGGYPMTVSDEFVARYKDIPFDNLCFVLRVGGLRYDPDTGRRLPTYILANIEALQKDGSASEPGTVSEELPLAVPSCFKVAHVTYGGGRASLTESGCTYKYHPWSGRQLDAEEAAAFAALELSLDGSAAPGTPAEEARVALDRRHWVTGAQAETLARR
jgi:hypothetical protein